MSDSPPADAAPAPPPAPGAFAVGSACFCAHQSNWYKARVRQVAGDGGRRRYLVHYDGWNKRFDTWLPVRPKRGALSTPARRAPRALTPPCATRRARTSSP